MCRSVLSTEIASPATVVCPSTSELIRFYIEKKIEKRSPQLSYSKLYGKELFVFRERDLLLLIGRNV
jgi:hypothetical protein